MKQNLKKYKYICRRYLQKLNTPTHVRPPARPQNKINFFGRFIGGKKKIRTKVKDSTQTKVSPRGVSLGELSFGG